MAFRTLGSVLRWFAAPSTSYATARSFAPTAARMNFRGQVPFAPQGAYNQGAARFCQPQAWSGIGRSSFAAGGVAQPAAYQPAAYQPAAYQPWWTGRSPSGWPAYSGPQSIGTW